MSRDKATVDIEAIVVSGDIGWSGQRPDYEFALKALRQFREVRPNAPILLTPGNHDVDLRPGLMFDERQVGFEWLLREFYGSSLKEIYPFMDDPSHYGLSRRESIIGFLHLTDRALFVSVNSSALQDTASFPIGISGSVLQAIEDHEDKLDVSLEALRVFALHHHLMPFAEAPWSATTALNSIAEDPDPSMVSNSARVQDWLARRRYGLVLHGHKHRHHGREDRLWAGRGDHIPRRLVLVGGGSCGVSEDQREHGEPLSYNVVEASPIAGREWRIRILAQTVDEGRTPVAATPWFRYSATAGRKERPSFGIFEARAMDDCHREIRQQITPDQPFRNFISIVESSAYKHPSSIRIRGSIPSQEDVARSFGSLHPEYSSATEWDDLEHIRSALGERRHRLEHGSRLFEQLPVGESPMDVAIRRISGRPTWSYVGLYRPGLDTQEEPSPLPGLVGLQFVRDDQYGRLDIVATFRNLELSFWWAVNMYEFDKLLSLAIKRSSRSFTKGSVTMFSSLAEWKTDPAAVFTARIDEMSWQDIVALSIRLSRGEKTAFSELQVLIKGKDDSTSRNNVELAGLRRLSTVLPASSAESSEHSFVLQAISEILVRAIQFLEGAELHTGNVPAAKAELGRAITQLKSYQSM